jgi:hypothetical protein
MKSTIYYSKRKFTTEAHTEVTKSKLVYDFTALIAAMKVWAR